MCWKILQLNPSLNINLTVKAKCKYAKYVLTSGSLWNPTISLKNLNLHQHALQQRWVTCLWMFDWIWLFKYLPSEPAEIIYSEKTFHKVFLVTDFYIHTKSVSNAAIKFYLMIIANKITKNSLCDAFLALNSRHTKRKNSVKLKLKRRHDKKIC